MGYIIIPVGSRRFIMSFSSCDEVVISVESICNIIKELDAIKILHEATEDVEEKNDVVNEGIDTVVDNLLLLLDGVEYTNDDLSYLSEGVKGVE
jgi:hypothetical protein